MACARPKNAASKPSALHCLPVSVHCCVQVHVVGAVRLLQAPRRLQGDLQHRHPSAQCHGQPAHRPCAHPGCRGVHIMPPSMLAVATAACTACGMQRLQLFLPGSAGGSTKMAFAAVPCQAACLGRAQHNRLYRLKLGIPTNGEISLCKAQLVQAKAHLHSTACRTMQQLREAARRTQWCDGTA